MNAIDNLTSEISRKGTNIQAGGAPIGSISHVRSTDLTEGKTERTDPHDLILRDVLGALTDSKLIADDPSKAQSGSLILVHGDVTILDYNLYPKMLDFMATLIEKSSPVVKRKQQKKTHKSSMRSDLPLRDMNDLLKRLGEVIPWTVNMIMQAESNTYWGGIARSNFRESPETLAIKHGPTLHGIWYMLALVDSSGLKETTNTDDFPEMITNLLTVTKKIRSIVGRPETFIGVTPLLLFRKISPH